MSLQPPTVSVLIPHFKRIKSHWETLRSALEQDYDSFTLIIGCDPDVLDSVIKFINDYRYSVDHSTLFCVRLFDDKEEMDETEYHRFLKANAGTVQCIILDAGMKFAGTETLSKGMSALSHEQGSLQEIVSPHIIPGSNLPFFSVNDPIPEDIKKNVVHIRNIMFKHSRMETILKNLIWIVFLMTMAAFLRSYNDLNMQILYSLLMSCFFLALCNDSQPEIKRSSLIWLCLFMIIIVFFRKFSILPKQVITKLPVYCVYLTFALLIARIIARIAVLAYDKAVIWRRRRRI